MKWTLEGLSTSVKHTKFPSEYAYAEMIIMLWNDKTLEGLGKSVKQIKGQVHLHRMKWTFT